MGICAIRRLCQWRRHAPDDEMEVRNITNSVDDSDSSSESDSESEREIDESCVAPDTHNQEASGGGPAQKDQQCVQDDDGCGDGYEDAKYDGCVQQQQQQQLDQGSRTFTQMYDCLRVSAYTDTGRDFSESVRFFVENEFALQARGNEAGEYGIKYPFDSQFTLDHARRFADDFKYLFIVWELVREHEYYAYAQLDMDERFSALYRDLEARHWMCVVPFAADVPRHELMPCDVPDRIFTTCSKENPGVVLIPDSTAPFTRSCQQACDTFLRWFRNRQPHIWTA